MKGLRRLKRSSKPKGHSRPTRKPAIRRYRFDISNDDVLSRLDQGYTIKQCCALFNCSKNLIAAVIKGTRPEAPEKKSSIDKKDLCTCCNIRRKKKGNHFLCEYCFENKESPFYDHPVALSGFAGYNDNETDILDEIYLYEENNGKQD